MTPYAARLIASVIVSGAEGAKEIDGREQASRATMETVCRIQRESTSILRRILADSGANSIEEWMGCELESNGAAMNKCEKLSRLDKHRKIERRDKRSRAVFTFSPSIFILIIISGCSKVNCPLFWKVIILQFLKQAAQSLSNSLRAVKSCGISAKLDDKMNKSPV